MDEWYTPAYFWEALGIEFDLDPCSPGSPPSTVWAKRHLTKADNGLTAPWSGTVWLNPPFSSKREWYDRLLRELALGTVTGGISLMPNRTETHDLQEYMRAADALLFLKGRIYFERGSRPGANGGGVHDNATLRNRSLRLRRPARRCAVQQQTSRRSRQGD